LTEKTLGDDGFDGTNLKCNNKKLTFSLLGVILSDVANEGLLAHGAKQTFPTLKKKEID
jgi:hypothetical protein